MSNGANHNTSATHTKLVGRFCELRKLSDLTQTLYNSRTE